MAYKCSTCGQEHDDLPDIGAKYPYYGFAIPADERVTRVKWTTDTCIIDNKNHFIRGIIEIPLTDATGSFTASSVAGLPEWNHHAEGMGDRTSRSEP